MVHKVLRMNIKYCFKTPWLEKIGKYTMVFFILKGIFWLLMLGTAYLQLL